MSTPAQILANQKNAKSSTGPTSEAGKAISSQNALKHGAFSQDVVLAFESVEEFNAFRAGYVARLKPVGVVEATTVEDMVAAEWRMWRMQRTIKEYVNRETYLHPSRNPYIANADVMLSPAVKRLQQYENTFRRAYDSAWAKLKELQRNRQREETAVAAAETADPRPAQAAPATRAVAQNEPNIAGPGQPLAVDTAVAVTTQPGSAPDSGDNHAPLRLK